MESLNSKSTSQNLMNVNEVALYLRIPLKTVYRIAKQGKIKGIKIGKHWRFLKQDIDYYLLYGKNKVHIPDQISSVERRTSPRINCLLPCYIKVLIPQKKELQSQTRILNISEGGVFMENCENNYIFTKILNDDPIKLDFKLIENIKLEQEGRVLRVSDKGIAVKFRNLNPSTREMIRKYVG